MEWIFHKYFAKLTFYANEYLGDEEKSRDAIVNLFVTLWESRSRLSFKNENLLQGYLYSVAKGKTGDIVRENKKDEDLVKGLSYLFSSEVDYNKGDSPRVMTEAISYLQEMLDTLPPQYRTALQLRASGKTNKEIAKIMNITKASVRSNISRGIENLQKKFKKEDPLPLLLLLTDSRPIASLREAFWHLN